MNAERACTMGEAASTPKSHGEPRLIVRTWSLMASHGDRSPRLTLKAGRNGRYKAGVGNLSGA